MPGPSANLHDCTVSKASRSSSVHQNLKLGKVIAVMKKRDKVYDCRNSSSQTSFV